ncbi:MAG: glycoside hydrolase family protein, partial [Methermicoccaceae archaeon]
SPTLIVSQDGTGDYDDTSTQAIKNAISKAQSKGIGTVLIKQGTYLHDSDDPIEMPAGFALIGIEPNATLKVADDISPTQLIDVWDSSNIEIKNLTIDGNERCTAAVMAINRSNGAADVVENIQVVGCTFKGQNPVGSSWLFRVVDWAQSWQLKRVVFDRCAMLGRAGSGAEEDSITFGYLDGVQISNCWVEDIGRWVQAWNCNNVQAVNSLFRDIQFGGFILQGVHNGTVSNCVFEATTAGSTYIRSLGEVDESVKRSSYNNVVSNCAFHNVVLTIEARYDAHIVAPQIENCAFWGSYSDGAAYYIQLHQEPAGYGGQVLYPKLSNVVIYDPPKYGVQIDPEAVQPILEGVRIYTIDGASYAPIWLKATDAVLRDVHIVNTGTTSGQHPINIDAAGSIKTCEGLYVSGFSQGIQNVENIEEFVGYNEVNGLLSENSGDSSIPSGSTSTTITHGLIRPPPTYGHIQTAPTSDWKCTPYLANKGWTTFDVRGSDTSTTRWFHWRAWC